MTLSDDIKTQLAETETAAVAALKGYSDLAVAASLYDGVIKAMADYKSPEAIIYGLEAVVRAIRESSRQQQISELTIPGVQ